LGCCTSWRSCSAARRLSQTRAFRISDRRGLHFVAIVELTVALGHLPVDTFFESATVCAFLIAVLFLFVYWRYDAASLSVCIFPLVFVLTQVGAMETPIGSWPSTNVRALLLVHVMMVLLGYASLCCSPPSPPASI
jgi:ABC-type uncharacterized transport system permease subunit